MTTATVTKPRHRAWMPKTKTGCKTCKIRKVKCDEAKPHCKRCTSTGRICDGYDPTIARRRTSPTRTSVQPTSPPALCPSAVDFASEIRSLSVLSYLVPSIRLETIDERLSFQFFVTQAGPALSGYSDTSFWQRQLLQAAHQHAPVQHCLVALGAMYRRFHESTSSHIDDVSNEHFRFALNQSNKAIQHLVKHQHSAGIADKLMFMTCCVLFGSMANLQGQQQAALRHLRSGMCMLKEIEYHDPGDIPHHPIELDSLRSIFTGLDIQARSSLGWEEIKCWEPALGTRHSSPSTNRNFDNCSQSELHQLTAILLNDTLAFNRNCVIHPYSDRAAIQTTYQSLINRFDHTAHRLTTLVGTTSTPSTTLTATLLLNAQTHHYLRAAISPLAHHFSVTGTLSHAPYSPSTHFTTMMSHITALLPLPSSSPIYTLSPGPLSALWLIATSAPSSCVALRKQAIDLMLAHPRREGLFDGRLAGRIGRAAWALEQEATRRELELQEKEGVAEGDLVVLEHLRLVWMDIQYEDEDEETGGRRARVKLANAEEMGTGGGTVVIIDW